MTKLPGWRTGINSLVLSASRKPFKWKDHDCGFGLAFPAIKVQTGIDLAAPYENRSYTNALGAIKLIRSEGYESLADYIASKFEKVEIISAQYGDIAVLDGDHTGQALGLVLGERIGVLAPSGYGTIERCQAKFAFKIV